MSNEMFTQLPTTTSATLSDIICAVQGNTSVQETLGQIINLANANIVLNYPGNPNGHVAGSTFQFCWDSTDHVLYVCTQTGTALTAVWSPAGSITFPVAVTQGGTGLTSTTINDLLYSSANNVIAQLATVLNAVLTTNATGVPTWRALTDGQIVIGSSAGAPIPGNITGGTGIIVTNGNNTITISQTGSIVYSWNNVTAAMQTMAPANGYVANRSSLITFTLPTTASFGTAISIIGFGSGGWTIAQNAGQNIQIGTVTSTTGAGGSVSSSAPSDSLNLICIVANTTWAISGGAQGNLTIV